MSEVQFAKQFLTMLDAKPQKYTSDHIFNPETFQLRIPYTLPKLSQPQHPPFSKSTPTSQPAPGSEPSLKPPTLDLTLKSTRNPSFTLHLPSLPPNTPISTLKSQIHQHLTPTSPNLAFDKIKILYNKKPIPASKSSVHDVLGADAQTGGGAVEFGVMVMGGAADPVPSEVTVNLQNESEKVAAGPGSENAAVEVATGVNPEEVSRKLATEGSGMEGVEVMGEKESVPVQPGEESGREVLSNPAFWDDLQGFLEQRLRDAEEAKRVRGVFEQALR